MQDNVIGQLLLQQVIITEAEFANAVSESHKTSSPLVDVLVNQGIIGYKEAYHAIALYHKLPFVDLLLNPPENDYLEEADLNTYLHMLALPWQKNNDTLLIATTEINEALVRWANAKYGETIQFVITTPLDIRRAVAANFATKLSEESRFALLQNAPHLSAFTQMPKPQKNAVIVLFASYCIACIWLPSFILFASLSICHAIFAATMLFKIFVYLAGLKKPAPIDWENEFAKLDEKKLPVYSILIPMVREPQKLPSMIAAMQKMDYPPAKLDIKLVLEEDDSEMIAQAYALKPSYQFDIIRVPKSNPRTKPKACNYALRFCRGDYVTVFDADDEPEPTQLKKAIITFNYAPFNVLCVQARLTYYNRNDNWLTRCFYLEYHMLFNIVLRGLQRLSIPIPLGGTSNHLALAKLRTLGEWDPFNVTEDADLGTRLCARGYTTQMLDSYTEEEATNSFTAWSNQRARWIKGYMQTWLVHMRAPTSLYKALELKGFAGFQFFIGLSTFSFLIAPIVWGVLIIGYLGFVPSFPQWLYGLALTNLGLSIIGQIGCTLHSATQTRPLAPTLLFCALTYPLYLLMHSWASYKALQQLFVKPHIWNKTTHGLAKTITREKP